MPSCTRKTVRSRPKSRPDRLRLRAAVKLRFSARDDGPASVVHLTVMQVTRVGASVRSRGEALCRPSSTLRLELLGRQRLDDRKCCQECLTILDALRRRYRVSLPESSGLTAKMLINSELIKPEPRKRTARSALAWMDLPVKK